MIAKYKDRYFRCCKRENCIVLLSAEDIDGFRAIYKSDKSRVLRREKVVSFDDVQELLDIEFQGKFKNRWFEISLNKDETCGTMIFYNTIANRRSLYGRPEEFAERHGFSPFYEERRVVRFWDKTIKLEELSGLRAVINHFLPQELEEIKKLTIEEFIKLYKQFVADTEYINV